MLRLRMKELAQQQKMSMTLLSHRSEVAYGVIKACYRNPYRSINSETINKIAKALQVPATDLFEDVSEDYMKREMEEKRKNKDAGEGA
ncbi:XRE family transcriptional regulator [Ktedonosporobacter rubrisoli]|uniref:XRE family transcriptional regulator n=1 Tax=Ktedonosporobacter rubrisoli TaxID=2509675 RepID=A0A4P6JSV8_KTERU|nr:helix-turn-helix transcriptional regulator [Ktedonosporobacter rubrisoli]QBD78375.1 XRE family transcriptional regulator [Ktedonosporobacter rubrisoli]